MTIQDFQTALQLNADQVTDLQKLVADLNAFDQQIQADAPIAYPLLIGQIGSDAQECIALISSVLGITPDEAATLVYQLLGLPGEHTQSSHSSIGALSQLIEQLNP